MKSKVKNLSSTSCLISIEVSPDELQVKFDQVYTDIGKFARLPGFRPGRAPKDLVQAHYAEKAKQEVIKRAIPEFYLQAVRVEGLQPVAPPEVESAQFKDHRLVFSARVDVRPQIKLKNYKGIKVVKKKVQIKEQQVNESIERIRQYQAKNKEEGKVEEAKLKELVKENLQAQGEMESRADMERQLVEQLLKLASLDAPNSLVEGQIQELLNQLKMQRMMRGEKKEDLESKTKELTEQARNQAVQRVKLSFVLDEIAQKEQIEVNEEDVEKRVTAIAQRSGKTNQEVRNYLDQQDLFPGLKAELRDKKTLEFLLSQAVISEAK